MDSADRQVDGRQQRVWRRPAFGVLVVVAIALAAGAVWILRSPDEMPVGTERALEVDVNDCGVVSVDVGRQTWSTMGPGPVEVLAYGRGPEPGVLQRHTADEATFTSDLVDGSVTLQRHGRVVASTTACLIMP